MIKLIVTDIDGTLLKEGTSDLKESYFDMFNKLIDMGIVIAVASGRNETEIDGIFNRLKNKIYYISNNGAYITKGEKNYFKNTFKSKDAKRILDYLYSDDRFNNKPIVISTVKEGIFVTKKDELIVDYLQRQYKSKCKIIDNLDSLYDICLKINVFDDSGYATDLREMLHNKWNGKYFVRLSGLYWIDICANGTNKGYAVEYLQKKYHISKNETLVMGDNFNDIEMLMKAKYSFAPENACDEIKKISKYIMPPYYDDGPLKVLKTVPKVYQRDGGFDF